MHPFDSRQFLFVGLDHVYQVAVAVDLSGNPVDMADWGHQRISHGQLARMTARWFGDLLRRHQGTVLVAIPACRVRLHRRGGHWLEMVSGIQCAKGVDPPHGSDGRIPTFPRRVVARRERDLERLLKTEEKRMEFGSLDRGTLLHLAHWHCRALAVARLLRESQVLPDSVWTPAPA